MATETPVVSKSIEGLTDEIRATGDRLIEAELPARALAVDSLYRRVFASPTLTQDAALEGTRNCDAVKAAHNQQLGDNARFEGEFPMNAVILALMDALRSEIEVQIDVMGKLKLWVQLNIPRIEDGNNFGVSIQQETVNELSRTEEAAFAILDSSFKYYASRAKISTKVIKYAVVQDYVKSVIELDRKEASNLALCCLDLRNNYLVVHDLLLKNIEKLKLPRGAGMGSIAMY